MVFVNPTQIPGFSPEYGHVKNNILCSRKFGTLGKACAVPTA